MSDFPPIGDVQESERVAVTNGDASHLAWLRQRHTALSAERHMDIEVPGYDGRLILRCNPIPWPTVARVQSLLGTNDRDGRGLLTAQCDVLIAACREVLCRRERDAEPEPIDPHGEPRRIDPDLADLLGSGTTTARATLQWLFPSEVAISAAAGELLDWTRTAGTETNEELAGE